MQVAEVGVQVFGILFGRHLVHSWRPGLSGETISFQKKVSVDPVTHVGEYHLRLALGLFRNFLEFHGYGW
jgi:hypothetical protein